jgi:excisionase family DNA binding protein
MAAKQYSSFQIANLLHVSRQAVNQWIDKGYIQSYRTPGGHRRVSREDLIEFLGTRNIPVPPELNGPARQEREQAPAALAVVLIDDNDDYMTLLKQALADTLPNVKVAKHANAMDGLLAIGAEPPDLLILDLRMPTMNGAEVIKRLKANPLTSQLPVIVLTGVEDETELQSVRKLRVEKVLAKSRPLGEIAKEALGVLLQARRSAA